MSENKTGLSRRRFLGAGTLIALSTPLANAATITGGEGNPWVPDAASPPPKIDPNHWEFFTQNERVMVDALVETLIPSDELSPSGKDAGCTVFIDRQMAGRFGLGSRLFMNGPFGANPLPTQGRQSPLSPAEEFRRGLTSLHAYCTKVLKKAFSDLAEEQRESVLRDLESGKIIFPGEVSSSEFFKSLLARTMEGFFSDPVYGGNRDMVSWKMIGYPGARYDYLNWIERHNETYPNPPVSIYGYTPES